MHVIDNRAINQMLNNPELVSNFPFMTLTEEKELCCGRKSARIPRYEAIRANIAFMSDDKKKILKRLLGIGQAKVFHRTKDGVVSIVI